MKLLCMAISETWRKAHNPLSTRPHRPFTHLLRFTFLRYFYADVWVGTPPSRHSVIIDTGSALMAFPCVGCVSLFCCGVGEYVCIYTYMTVPPMLAQLHNLWFPHECQVRSSSFQHLSANGLRHKRSSLRHLQWRNVRLHTGRIMPRAMAMA